MVLQIAARMIVVLAVGLAAGLGLHGQAPAATTAHIVADRNTGLAISGFDPIAYFTERRASAGSGEFEYAFAGVVWRFCSASNRAAFIADPEVYMPRFGGYDPVHLTRGVTVPGNPELWLIVGERLYLFYSTQARDAFEADSDRTITTAGRVWSEIQELLVP
jgi:YHS domain-containing protein